ncbi:MAG: hypothetical protein M3O34_15035 [Chloroflexota bacterium]|nr:hypothetical protein [Chloroflexota bacterium]
MLTILSIPMLPGAASGASLRGPLDGGADRRQLLPPTSGAPDEAIRQDADEIAIFVNPARTILYPGERVLLSVGDSWLTANLTWEGRIVWGNLDSAGIFSSEPGPFVTYTAPSGHGDVEIRVAGMRNGRPGAGTINFAISP